MSYDARTLGSAFFARRRRSGLMGFGVRSVKALKAQALKAKLSKPKV